MKCDIIIDETRDEGVTVVLKAPSPLADEIRALCLAAEKTLIAYGEEGALRLSPAEVYAFTVSDGSLMLAAAPAGTRPELMALTLDIIL